MGSSAGRSWISGARLSLASNLAESPAWQPLVLDPAGDRALLVRLTEAETRAASFLDERTLGAQTRAQWVPLPELIAAAAPLAVTHRAIFHIGHVGSTLISRLLGEVPAFHALREYAALRTLAEARTPESWWSEAQHTARARALAALWSRVWRSGQTALIKATSFASETAGQYLARPDRPPALFVHTAAGPYLATIFAQEGNRAEAATLAPARLRRLHGRLGGPAFRLWEMSEGERIAMGWVSEMLTLAEARGVAPGRVRWLDFEAFLSALMPELVSAAAHLGAPIGDTDAAAIVAGPLMARYSKGPEHEYSPQLRRDLLAQTAREHAGEIARGLAWLERATTHAPIAAALEMVEG